MKRFLKITAWVVGILLIIILGFAAFIQIKGIPTYEPQTVDLKVEVTPERIEQGQKLSAMLCSSCHLSEKEQRLSGKEIYDLPKEFGVAYSKNITNDKVKGIGEWTDGEIYVMLRTGVNRDGLYSPPYMPKFPLMSDEDIYSIIAYLRSDLPVVQASNLEPPNSEPSFLTKLLCHVAFKPFPLPEKKIVTPDISDQVAYGKYLVQGQLACFGCHSADFKTVNDLEPEKSVGYLGGGNPMPDLEGKIIPSANITMDKETGIGNWTEEQFVNAMLTGQTPNGPMRYPMMPHSVLDTAEITAIWAYLKTVSPLKNAVARASRE